MSEELFGIPPSPAMDIAEFHAAASEKLRAGARAAAFFAAGPAESRRLYLALLSDTAGRTELLSCAAPASYPSFTPDFPQLHLFERELFEETGIRPVGHPWLKPVRFNSAQSRPGVMDFFRVHGAEVHEVAVGPVHAGVIEPGHFRFQCHGEKVFHLEISLGYQHRGVEARLAAGPDERGIHYAETLAGDTTIGHGWAYCQAIERLAGCAVPARAQIIRGIMLELERLAAHTGDLGALSGDVAYLPTSSFCGRLRGDFLNMTGLICGNRFGRNALKPGGVNFDLDYALVRELKQRLDATYRDVEDAVSLLWKTASVTDRFDATGRVTLESARELGLVGPAARASGVGTDTRRNFPYGPYRDFSMNVSGRGDVYARAYVRWAEIQKSAELIYNWFNELPGGPIEAECGPLAADSAVVSLTEGWRGQVCHVALTGGKGGFARYKVVDPSFHNWQGLALALRNGEVSDFPLCNKSFNLSYCGHDL